MPIDASEVERAEILGNVGFRNLMAWDRRIDHLAIKIEPTGRCSAQEEKKMVEVPWERLVEQKQDHMDIKKDAETLIVPKFGTIDEYIRFFAHEDIGPGCYRVFIEGVQEKLFFEGYTNFRSQKYKMRLTKSDRDFLTSDQSKKPGHPTARIPLVLSRRKSTYSSEQRA